MLGFATRIALSQTAPGTVYARLHDTVSKVSLALGWDCERLYAAGIVAVVATYLVGVFVVNPLRTFPWLRCPLYTLTGLYCPGCGSTRGLHFLLHGDVLLGLRYNPVMVSLLPFLGYSFLSQLSLAVRGRRLPGVFVPSYLIWALLGIILSFWLLRNIPLQPFSLLAPLK